MSGAFSYRSGVLCAEDVPLDKIAAEVGTPFYCYSSARLKQNYEDFAGAFKGLDILVCYANKANPNQAVTRTFAKLGASADVTSVGEMERALKAGIVPQKIIFSGVGKRRDEIEAALKTGIRQLNVESIPELKMIDMVAGELKKRAVITVRVNPDVDPHTHKKIATGEMGTKFGIDLAQLDEVMALIKNFKNLDFRGFQVHIGSHLSDYEPFRVAYAKLAELVQAWRNKGFTIDRLDLGGGVGIEYDGQKLAPFSDYAKVVRETVGKLDCELAFEPGRRLVGDASVLVSRVTYDKQGLKTRFLILDAGMNDLVRPAMYDARHTIIPVKENSGVAKAADVVGPVCETSDLFGKDYKLPGVGQGDLVAILQAGAYGAAMASTYNGRPLIPEVLVAGKQWFLVRRRIEISEQIGWEALPPWLA